MIEKPLFYIVVLFAYEKVPFQTWSIPGYPMSSPVSKIEQRDSIIRARPVFARFQRSLRRVKGIVSDFIYHLFL